MTVGRQRLEMANAALQNSGDWRVDASTAECAAAHYPFEN
jgi:hypothetical protein